MPAMKERTKLAPRTIAWLRRDVARQHQMITRLVEKLQNNHEDAYWSARLIEEQTLIVAAHLTSVRIKPRKPRKSAG